MRTSICKDRSPGSEPHRAAALRGRAACVTGASPGRSGWLRLGLALALVTVALVLALSRLGRSPAPIAGEPVASPRAEIPAERDPGAMRPQSEARPADDRSPAGEPAEPARPEAAAPGPLEGVVTDELGAPIGPPAPRLELGAPDGRVVSVPVDELGRWRLDAMTPGTWELTASAAGHITERMRTEVRAQGDRAPLHVVLRRAERVLVRLETPGGPADPDELQDELQALAPFLEVRLGEAWAVPTPARLPSSPHQQRWGLQASLERGVGATDRIEVHLGDVLVATRQPPGGMPRALVIALDPAELRRRLVSVRVRILETDEGEPSRPSSAFLRAGDARWVLEATVLEPLGELSLEAVPPGPAELVLTMPDGSTHRCGLAIPAEGPAELNVVLDA